MDVGTVIMDVKASSVFEESPSLELLTPGVNPKNNQRELHQN